jgi:MFS family permease
MTLVKYRVSDVTAPRGGGRPIALAILCTLLFLTFLDNTIVSVGLGSVQADLHAGVLALQWIVGAYALTFAGAMLAFGMVGDEFGRKKVMLAGAAVFCAGSVLCAVRPGAQLRGADRGPGRDGTGRGRQRAGHLVHAPASLYR